MGQTFLSKPEVPIQGHVKFGIFLINHLSNCLFFLAITQQNARERGFFKDTLIFIFQDLSKGSPQTSSCFPVRGSAKVADNETSSHRNHKPTRERGIPHPIDRASRILFPVAYFVFLLIYCIAFVAY